MTIPDAFLKVADAAVQTGCGILLARILRTMDYPVSDPSGEDGLLDEDELLTVSPDHMCIVGCMLLGRFYEPMSGIMPRVPVECADKIRRGMERIAKGLTSEGVSDSALEADMDNNMDLL